jgi:hypothetical protein
VNVELNIQQSSRHSEMNYVELENEESAPHSIYNNKKKFKVNVELDNQQSARHLKNSYVELDNQHSAQHSIFNNNQRILKVNVELHN